MNIGIGIKEMKIRIFKNDYINNNNNKLRKVIYTFSSQFNMLSSKLKHLLNMIKSGIILTDANNILTTIT